MLYKKAQRLSKGLPLLARPCCTALASNSKVGMCSLPGPQVLVIRLRDTLIRMGEEMAQAAVSEAQQRESSRYSQGRLEELKADMEELMQREAEAGRRCMELVSAVPALAPPARRA